MQLMIAPAASTPAANAPAASAPAVSALILNNQDDSKATGQPAKLLVNNAFA